MASAERKRARDLSTDRRQMLNEGSSHRAAETDGADLFAIDSVIETIDSSSDEYSSEVSSDQRAARADIEDGTVLRQRLVSGMNRMQMLDTSQQQGSDDGDDEGDGRASPNTLGDLPPLHPSTPCSATLARHRSLTDEIGSLIQKSEQKEQKNFEAMQLFWAIL
jgi:hypothetical protein